MAVNLSTRKPVNLLTPEDFAAFPVWEYEDEEEGVEGRDETWVRPVDSAVVPTRSYTHVAADFTAASGREFSGYVTVSTLHGPPEVCQGTIFHDGTSLFVCNLEAFKFRQMRDDLLEALGLTGPEFFPLAFRLRVPLAGGPGQVAGVLP